MASISHPNTMNLPSQMWIESDISMNVSTNANIISWKKMQFYGWKEKLRSGLVVNQSIVHRYSVYINITLRNQQPTHGNWCHDTTTSNCVP